MEEGIWPNRHITFIVAEKLNSQFLLLYLFAAYVEGRGWLKKSYGRRGLKLLKKPSYDI